MAKKRMNVSVDESVHAELKQRDDINVSGLVNDFLKRYLRGEESDSAAEKLRAERLEREAKEKMEEAESLKNQAEQIRKEFEKEREREQEKWQQACQALASMGPPDDSKVRFWADELNTSPEEVKRRVAEYDREDTSDHHYQ